MFRWRAVCVMCALQVIVATSALAQKDDSKSASAGLPLKLAFAKGMGCRPVVDSVSRKVTFDPPDIERLIELYQDWERWKDLQSRLTQLLKACVTLEPSQEHPAIVTLLNGTESYSVVVPQTLQYSQTLRGVETIDAVVLMGPDPAEKIKSIDITLLSTKTDNPVVTQIPDFIKNIVTAQVAPLTIQLHGAVDTVTKGGTPPNIVAYKAKQAKMPFTRASIVAAGTIVQGKQNADKSDDKPDNNVKATVNVTYQNRPPSNVELTVVAGAITGPMAGAEKMKVDSGKYASNPVGRALTMAAVSLPFASFDDSDKLTKGQRTSVLLGGVLTPAPGFGAGLSVKVIKGFGINFGGALLWVPTARDGKQPGDEAPKGADQLTFAWTAGAFVGGTYVFK